LSGRALIRKTGGKRDSPDDIRRIGGHSDDDILCSGAKIIVVYSSIWYKLHRFCDLRVSCRNVALWHRRIYLEFGGLSEVVFHVGQS
ncbi:hypothetical protein, partial [Acidithiobacillus caldus]|uniref:hypothetical protein n=1 Tax=Acidithiobacillus caldus TaxID=33059 RepID=UPI001A7E0C3F